MAMTAEGLRQPLLYTIDIKNGLIQQPIRPQLMKDDKKANTIIVRVMDGAQEADLTGATVTGSFISPVGGAEIPLTGSVNGNEASVTLIDECYAEDGYFEANVKLTVGETSRTILSITGHVLSKGSGAVIDIGDVIPSIDDIIAQYQAMKDAVESTNSARDAANAAAGNANNATTNANNAAAKINGMTVSASSSSTAGATISEKNGVKHIAFSLPKGDKGDKGDPGTIENVTITSIDGLQEALDAKQPKGNYLTSESDPTVPAWAKAASKPSYTANEVGARPSTWMPSASDVGALPSGGTAVNASKLGGKAPAYYTSPRNLLDNSDFTYPVNQRRSTSYTTANGTYTIDRWLKRGSGTESAVSVGNGYVRVEKYTTTEYVALKQPINLTENRLQGKTVTAAIKVKAVTINTQLRITGGTSAASDAMAYAYVNIASPGIYCVSCSVPDTLSYEYFGVSIAVGTLMNGSGIISNAGYVDLEWAALYEGEYTADNLPPYVAKGYAAELTECMRYYIEFGRLFVNGFVTSSAKSYTMPIPLSVPMRINNPSILGRGSETPTWFGRTPSGYSKHTSGDYTAFTSPSVAQEGSILVLNDTISSTKDENNIPISFAIYDIAFSADL